MINIGILHIGKLDGIENIYGNNPSLFEIPHHTAEYKLNFITSTWYESYIQKNDFIKTHEHVKQITKKLTISKRDDMYKFFDNKYMEEYLVKYFGTNSKKEDTEGYYSSLKFFCDSHFSQFYTLFRGITKNNTNDIFIKLRPDINLRHVNMEEYIELVLQMLCMKKGRFNDVYREWFNLGDLQNSQRANLSYMKVMFATEKYAYAKDQYFSFNKSKANQIINDFSTKLPKLCMDIQERGGHVNGDALWYSLMIQDSYMINDDWFETMI